MMGMLRIKNKGIVFLTFILLFLPLFAYAQQNEATENVTVYLFWGDGCPHCEEQIPFMESLESKYPLLEVVYLETWYNRSNAELFVSLSKAYGTSASGVPATFIGSEPPIFGYAGRESTGKEIEQKIINCLDRGCINPITKLSSPENYTSEENNSLNKSINIPLFGNVDADKISLPLFTLIIAGLDSFNPCAFFVLLFLLSMLVYAGSRKRMLLIGGIFIFFSGFLYFLFMAAWLNLFLWTGEIIWITMIAGILAIVISLINIKDFFFFKKGLSLTIPEKAKPKLFQRMRNLIKESSLWSLIFGTAVLAVVANTYELLCTAGFPMVFTKILTLNNLSTSSYYLYLVFYNLIYVVPLAVIVGIFTYTLGSRKLSEQEGKILKLISGIMMLLLGLALVFKPSILNNLLASVIMVLLAVGISFLIIFLNKKLGNSGKI